MSDEKAWPTVTTEGLAKMVERWSLPVFTPQCILKPRMIAPGESSYCGASAPGFSIRVSVGSHPIDLLEHYGPPCPWCLSAFHAHMRQVIYRHGQGLRGDS